MARILVIGDDSQALESLRACLVPEGYEITVAKAFASGLAEIRRGKVDAVILDVTHHHADGYRLLRSIREIDVDAPLLMLNRSSSENDKVRAFRMGADDYLTKPVGFNELLARVETRIRRRNESLSRAPQKPYSISPVIRSFGSVEVNASSLQVWRDGRLVNLRPREVDLLLALIDREGRVVTRQELLQRVWGYEKEVSSRTVDNHVARLRRKLEQHPSKPVHILSVRKKGYRFQS